ncbi:MAG TPA: protein kinase [Polyangiaceae bacterium]|jgi:serine/threonine-protein kinase
MVHAPPLPIALGELLAGKYRVDSVLGRGGMGVVLAATHLQLEQRVAIKFLADPGERASLPEMRERFAREARAASKIRSEHVARVLDVGTLDCGTPYTVMEYLAGEDLGKTLRSRGALPVAEAVGYVLQACEALAEAHAAGIVHRDLKPANVFLARRADGSLAVKLLDFGISKVLAPGAHGAITNRTSMLGSPVYMPPEQIRCARDVDARGDLWSVGATLFELIAGRPPFRAETLPELCVRILEEQAPALELFAPDAPRGLGDVVQRCLAKEPAARFANVAELAAALEPFGPVEARLSVERVARILSAEAWAEPAPQASSDSETLRLQDAATMKPRVEAIFVAKSQGERPPEETPSWGETAHSVASSSPPEVRRASRRGAALALGGFAAVVGIAVGAMVLRTPDSPRAALVAAPRAPSAEPAPSAPLPLRLVSTPTEPVAATTVPAALRSGGGSPRAAVVSHRRKAAPSPAAPPPVAPPPAEKPTERPASLGTAGFGDRK